jgi:hypothetical protein
MSRDYGSAGIARAKLLAKIEEIERKALLSQADLFAHSSRAIRESVVRPFVDEATFNQYRDAWDILEEIERVECV